MKKSSSQKIIQNKLENFNSKLQSPINRYYYSNKNFNPYFDFENINSFKNVEKTQNLSNKEMSNEITENFNNFPKFDDHLSESFIIIKINFINLNF